MEKVLEVNKKIEDISNEWEHPVPVIHKETE